MQDADGAARGHLSAFRNFSRARRGWLKQAGVTDVAHQCELVSRRAPFSVGYLIERGRADYATARLAKAGATVDDLPALRAVSLALLDAYDERRDVPV